MRLALFDLDHTLEDARALLRRHRDAGDTLVLTTATNRVISELTAADLCVDHYICTELEQVDGRLTGRTSSDLNMRAGKVHRLRQWLSELGQPDRLLNEATFYSDSINDLALLSVVRRPVVIDPDPRLESAAVRKSWTVLRLNRSSGPCNDNSCAEAASGLQPQAGRIACA